MLKPVHTVEEQIEYMASEGFSFSRLMLCSLGIGHFVTTALPLVKYWPWLRNVQSFGLNSMFAPFQILALALQS